MIAPLEQKRPAAVATAGPGGNTGRTHRSTCRPALPRAIDLFVERWDEAARRFLSAFFRDTYEGHRVSVDAGLNRGFFPRAELWQLAEILGACAWADLQRPCLPAILGHGDDVGIALIGSNDHDLDWLRDLESSTAALPAYAKELGDFGGRAALAGELYRAYLALLDPLTPLAETVAGLRQTLAGSQYG